MPYIQHRSLAMGISLGAVLASAYAGPTLPRPSLTRQTPLYYYSLGGPTFNEEHLSAIGRSLKLQPQRSNDGIMEIQEDGISRGFVSRGAHAQLLVVPNLQFLKEGLPTREVAVRQAEGFAREMKLVPSDEGQLTLGDVNTWTRQSGAQNQRPSAKEDMVRTVVFARKLDGLMVYGPSSSLAVNVTAMGVQGVSDTIRQVHKTDRKVDLKPAAEARRELDPQLAMLKREKTKQSVKNLGLVYYENDGQIVQPAYAYAVTFNGPKGQKTANMYFVAAGRNTPEKIEMPMFDGKPPVEPSKNQRAANLFDNLYATTKPQANPIKVGVYVVRHDDSCWLNDGWAFWSNLQHGGSPKQLRDYYWDYPWLWEDFGGTSNQSRYYGGQCHICMLEGHGLPWWMSCYENWGDVINIWSMTGFGGNAGLGEVTAYMIRHSCEVIPAPGDPYGGNYSSGGPFDVWWHIFRGLRGTYGYRTTMAICDGVGGSYGDQISRGVPMLSSWLGITGGLWYYHIIGWDYGSAVILAGHEGDTLYNNSPGPTPGSLTIWWNH